MNTIKGKVWIFEDNVDTDQILPGYAMTEKACDLHKFVMAGSRKPNFAQAVGKGDIIVAGKNFGCGSSREQAPVALKNAGVSLIIAESLARIFRRNAINIGLPVICGEILSKVKEGDMLSVSLEQGTIALEGRIIQNFVLSPVTLETIQAGGLINRVRQELHS